MATMEEFRKRIKSEQSAKWKIRQDRDYYKQMCKDLQIENDALRAKIADEVNREWSPEWLKNKLVEAQLENERLKKYVMALEEGKAFNWV